MRKLVIGEATYLWHVSHPRRGSGEPRGGEDVFTAYLEGHPNSPLRVVFSEENRDIREDVTSSGIVPLYDQGTLAWNLNLPATARELIELARGRGWTPESVSCPFEVTDGWSLASQLTAPM